jgi:hypothetical protein
MSDVSANDVLDEGLSRLAATGPEFRGGLSNHGPMAAEALVRLGRADAVEHWLDTYLKRLEAAPRPSDRVTDATWRDALGQLNRVADWDAYLRAQLAEERWRDVLARWWPRLLPGVAAAATHGIIRTSHAARSLAGAGENGDAEPVLDEPEQGGLITGRLKNGLPRLPGMSDALAALRPPADADTADDLRDLAGEFTRVFLGYGRAQPITFLHAVTAPVAAYSVLPLLPRQLARPTHDALWQVGASLYAVHAGAVTPEPLPTASPLAPGDLADLAVASGDEHAIKLTEACLRLHAETPDPVFLHAAARASDLLGRG